MGARISITHKFALLLLVLAAGTIAAVGAYYTHLTRDDQTSTDMVQSLTDRCKEVHRRIDDPVPLQTSDREQLKSFIPVAEEVLSTLERNAPHELAPNVAAAREAWRPTRRRLLNAAGSTVEDEREQRSRLHDEFPKYQATINLLNRSLANRRAALRDHMKSTFIVVCAIHAVFLIGGVWATRRFIVQPIQNVEAAAQRVAAGDYSHIVPVTANDETGELATAFNRMSHELQSNMSALRESEAALAAKAQQLAVKNAELEQFSYAASHDLQEPLRMVIAYSQMLKTKFTGQLAGDGELYLNYIEAGAGRMKRLLADLLCYYGRVHDVGSGKKVDSRAALEAAIVSCGVAISESNAEVRNDQLPDVIVDPIGLELVFQNLIANAIKYRSEAPPTINITAETFDGMCTFRVQDNGIGIRREYHERIFGLFKRLHGRDIPGTGIGLALVRKIVEKHGGAISVESDEGRGSTFVFSLPAAEVEQVRAVGAA